MAAIKLKSYEKCLCELSNLYTERTTTRRLRETIPNVQVVNLGRLGCVSDATIMAAHNFWCKFGATGEAFKKTAGNQIE